MLYALLKLFGKWCLDESVEQTENGLERGFVKQVLSNSAVVNSV